LRARLTVVLMVTAVIPLIAAGVLVGLAPASAGSVAWPVAGGLLAAAALAAAGAALGARRLTAPLTALTDVVTRIGEGDLTVRTEVRGADEVGRLAQEVNTMAWRLEAAASRGRDGARVRLERFTDALTHTHDRDALLHTVAAALLSATSCSRCTVFLAGAPGQLVPRAQATGVVPRWPARLLTARRIQRLARAAVANRAEVTAQLRARVHVTALPLQQSAQVLGSVVLEGDRRLDGERLEGARSLTRAAAAAVRNVLVHEEASRLAVTDPLTGLANRRSLTENLTREVERAARFGHPLSVLVLDLDHFKTVNDSRGHAAGDAVLRELAGRLHGLVREVDTVARYGGEEFVLVLPETDAAGAQEVARRVVHTVRTAPFDVGVAPPVPVTVSAGVATYPLRGDRAGDLLRSADQALYRAKAAGRDQWAVAGPQDREAR
jgi:diguanylate cyclase (GGDEF)-like protein